MQSHLARTEGVMGSGFRFSSLFGSPLPSPVAAAALPTINNHILRKHLDAVNTLQQRMLEAELRCRPGGKAAASTATDEQVRGCKPAAVTAACNQLHSGAVASALACTNGCCAIARCNVICCFIASCKLAKPGMVGLYQSLK
jgi:hypothetical protein